MPPTAALRQWVQRTIFDHLINAVIPHPAHITAAGGFDVVPQRELRVPAVHHVRVARRQLATQNALLIAFTGVLWFGDLPRPGHVMAVGGPHVASPAVPAITPRPVDPPPPAASMDQTPGNSR